MSICEHCNCDHAELDPAPERIYLQWIDDLGDGATWCQVQINRCDPAYILATPKVVTAVNCLDELVALARAIVAGNLPYVALTGMALDAIDRATGGE